MRAMSHAKAFLSYTHTDDACFRGRITSLRKLLELRVKVITGDETFEIFQDVDGIELGQQWEKRIDDAITSARFLIPILTPCFLGSRACRDELSKFIQHERVLSRDDLILPIYFVTVPSLERADLGNADPLAVELSKRQRYDWRDWSELPVTNTNFKRAVKELSEKIARAIQRTDEISVQTRQAAMADRLREPELDRQFERASLQVEREEEIKPTLRKNVILWVDDRPDNNIYEREALEHYGIEFVLANSTSAALKLLTTKKFDVIISDMGRPSDARAGYSLLEAIRSKGDLTPYFIYAGSRSARDSAEAERRGAQGTTNMPTELVDMVLGAIQVFNRT